MIGIGGVGAVRVAQGDQVIGNQQPGFADVHLQAHGPLQRLERLGWAACDTLGHAEFVVCGRPSGSLACERPEHLERTGRVARQASCDAEVELRDGVIRPRLEQRRCPLGSRCWA